MNIDCYNLFISDWVLEKLKIHCVTEQEVEEAFFNCTSRFIKEMRKKHKTRPPTFWFVSQTFDGRSLKIVFIPIHESQTLLLKSAYTPDPWEITEYENYT